MNFVRYFLILVFGFILSGCGDSNSGTEPETVTYTINGTVQDANGAIAQATVSITNFSQLTASTTSSGSFMITNVPAGTHEVVVMKEYFGKFVEKHLTVQVNADVNLNTVTLSQPSSLSFVNTGLNRDYNLIQLTWSKTTASDFKQYQLYRGETFPIDESNATLIHTASQAGDTTFMDNAPHGTHFYYRLYEMNDQGRIAGSNVVDFDSPVFTNDAVLTVGQINNRYISTEETFWMEFPVTEGSLYQISWNHPDWNDNVAIRLSGYNESSSPTTTFFENATANTESASSKMVMAYFKNETKIRLKAQAIDSTAAGIFSIYIERISYVNISQAVTGSPTFFTIAPDEVKVFHLDVLENQTVMLQIGDPDGNSQEVDVHLMLFGNQLAFVPYISDRLMYFDSSFPNEVFFNTPTSERLYVVLNGSYFYDTRSIYIRGGVN